ncbi:hypothetical protein DVH24_010740, partial [Malus domestica]
GFLENIGHGRLTADLFRKTSKENNILHIAAELKQINFFKKEKINHESPRYWATNKNGETPLHVAARVGCDKVLTFLIDRTISLPIEGVDPEEQPIDGEAYKKLLRMTNLYSTACCCSILSCWSIEVFDPELCCSCYSTKESSLFLAARAKSTSIAGYILNETPVHISPFQRTNGVTALHAAATRKYFTDKVQLPLSKILLKRLGGLTPLHCASLRGNFKAAHLLIQNSNSTCYISDMAT